MSEGEQGLEENSHKIQVMVFRAYYKATVIKTIMIMAQKQTD